MTSRYVYEIVAKCPTCKVGRLHCELDAKAGYVALQCSDCGDRRVVGMKKRDVAIAIKKQLALDASLVERFTEVLRR